MKFGHFSDKGIPVAKNVVASKIAEFADTGKLSDKS